MPYIPHFRLTVSGVLGPRATPSEAFSFGVSLGDNSGVVSLPPSAEFDQMCAETVTFFGQSNTKVTTAAAITEIRLAMIGPEGRVVLNGDGSYAQYKKAYTTGANGTVTTVFHPFQVATGVSMLTPRSGQNGRGRFYLPASALSVGTDGRISAADAQIVSLSCAGWLSTLNAAMTGTSRVIVASQGSVRQGLGPVNSPVTSVRVGRVLDTIRSRRTSLLEEYSTNTVSA